MSGTRADESFGVPDQCRPRRIVNEDALCHALKQGKLPARRLMSWKMSREDHPLFQLDNVILTPHIGALI